MRHTDAQLPPDKRIAKIRCGISLQPTRRDRMIVVQLIAVIDWGCLIPAILGLDQVTVLISLRRGSSSSSSPSWRRAAICSNKLGGITAGTPALDPAAGVTPMRSPKA